MKSLINTNVLLFVMLAPLLMMQSCSQSYKLSEKKHSYHLNLVKAVKIKLPPESNNTVKENTVAEAAPIQRPSVGCKQRDALRSAEAILPLVLNKQLHLCSSAFKSAKTIRPLDPVQINSNQVKYQVSNWDDDDNDLIMNPPRIILICGIFVLVTAICFVYASKMPFLYFIGWLMGVAALVFFVIWLLSLRDYHTF